MGRVSFEIVPNSARREKISDEEYFGPKYKGYVSNSRLSLINPDEGGSIDKYLKGIPDEPDYKSYFAMGHAVHGKILQPESTVISDIPAVRSSKMRQIADYIIGKGSMSDKVITEAIKKIGYHGTDYADWKIRDIKEVCSSYVNAILSGDKSIFLTNSDREKVNKCIESFYQSEAIHSVYDLDDDEEGQNEMTYFLDIKAKFGDRECILHLKGKIDHMVEGDNTYRINDLKTTMHSNGGFKNSVSRYHYARQAFFYSFLVAQYYEQHGIKKKYKGFNFLWMSTSDCSAGIYKITRNDWKAGLYEFHLLLEMAALAEMDGKDRKDSYIGYYCKLFSTRIISASFHDRIKMVSLLLFILQQFRKKDKGFSVRMLIQRIRKEKYAYTSDTLIDRLEAIIEANYSDDEKYPVFGLSTAKEMSTFINEVMDKELPFSSSSPWIWGEEELPF